VKPAFADAGFWIALANPRDSLHSSATAAAASLQGRKIITTQVVLAEFLNDMAGRGSRLRSIAREAAERILASHDTIVVPQTDAQFRSALALYGQRADRLEHNRLRFLPGNAVLRTQ
jgi:predicted nucleic acid-binding protein